MYPEIKITSKGLRWFRSNHPWIFATDLADKQTDEAGIVSILSPKNEFLALALYSPFSQIALRILSKKKEEVNWEWWHQKIKAAIAKRAQMGMPSNAKRLVYAEADGLPSLIVDRYGDYLVCQTLSAGLEKYKEEIFTILRQTCPVKGLLERNDVEVRKKEKLPLLKQRVWGEVPATTIIKEGDCEFIVDLWNGHKTGAYLDQRTNRLLAAAHAQGDVLDAFAYQGWFACQMAKKSNHVLCVESSEAAIELIGENAKRNGVAEKISVQVGDTFDFLTEQERCQKHFDTINLDPPPFAKRRGEISGAARGYNEINRRAMQLLKPKGLLITSSCSYHFSRQMFEGMLAKASLDAKVGLKIKQRMGAAIDHPTLPRFPEGDYLQCYFVKTTLQNH